MHGLSTPNWITLSISHHKNEWLYVWCTCSNNAVSMWLPRFKENEQFMGMLNLHKEAMERFGTDAKYDYWSYDELNSNQAYNDQHYWLWLKTKLLFHIEIDTIQGMCKAQWPIWSNFMDMSRTQAAEISCRSAADEAHSRDSKPLPALPCELCWVYNGFSCIWICWISWCVYSMLASEWQTIKETMHAYVHKKYILGLALNSMEYWMTYH